MGFMSKLWIATLTTWVAASSPLHTTPHSTFVSGNRLAGFSPMASSPYRRFIRPSALRRQQERGNSLDGFQKRRVITGTLILGLLQNLPVGGRRADAKADPRA